MIYLFTLLFLLVSITKVLILLLNFGSREMAGSLQTGFGLMMMCEERGGPIYYINLFILALSCLSSITKARWYFSWTLGIARWLLRSRPVLASWWCARKGRSDLLYKFIYFDPLLPFEYQQGYLILLLDFGNREMAGSLQTGFGLMMMCEERGGPIYYIYLFILVISFLWASLRLCDTAPGLWESRDGWFAPDRFWTSSW